jgi:hypothetical protein
MTFQGCFLPSFGSFGKAVSKKKNFFRKQPIRNKNCLWWPCLLTIGTKLEDHPWMLPTKFRFISPSGYRVEDSLEINQLETRIACGGRVCKRIGTK